MPRSIIQVYAAGVCFVAVACFALSVGVALYSAVGAIMPEFTVHPMAAMPPPDPPITFGPFPLDPTKATTSPTVLATPKPSAEEEAKRRAEAVDRAIKFEKATSQQSVLRWGIAAVISGVLFAAHWALLRRETRRAA